MVKKPLRKELSLADQEFLARKESLQEEALIDQAEALLIRSPHTNIQLSVKLDVTVARAKELREKVQLRWQEPSRKKAKDKRAQRVRQLEHMFEKSLIEFEESQKQETEASIEMVLEPCDRCDGTGVRRGDFCVTCEGNGTLERKTVRREYVRVPGNPAFIQAATKILNEIIKLEGITPPTKQEIRSKSTLSGTVLTAGFLTDNPFANAPTELLHQALAALHHLKTGAKPVPEQPVLEGEVLHGDRSEDAEGR